MSSQKRLIPFSLALALLSRPAFAVVDQFTLNAGESSYTETNLLGGRLEADSGVGSFTTGGVASPMQNWWWFRGGNDSREYALSNQVDAVVQDNFAELTYDEAVGSDGNATLRFILRYELTEVQPGFARMFIGWSIANLTGNVVPIRFLPFLDIDLAGTAGDDSAVITGSGNTVQTVTDATLPVSMRFIAGQRRLQSYQMGDASFLRGLLTNGGPDDLDGSGSPFGPGDYAGAFEYGSDILAANAIITGSITKELEAVPEPASLTALILGIIAVTRTRRSLRASNR